VNWRAGGLELQMFDEVSPGVRIQNQRFYGIAGVAFSPIGSEFSARKHRFLSVLATWEIQYFRMTAIRRWRF
jgi:hypothetical protein